MSGVSSHKKKFSHPSIYALMLMFACYIIRDKFSGHSGFLCLECLHIILKKLEHMSYSYSHDCNVSRNCMTYELCSIFGDDEY